MKTFYRIVVIICSSIIIVTLSYGIIAALTQGIEVVGLTLVTIEFPPMNIFPLFYSKPVTWFAAAFLVFWYCSLELNMEKIKSIPKPIRDFLKFLAFFIGSMAIYEVLFNFTFWSGQMAADAIRLQLNPDIIVNPFPNPESPWSIVFATKLFTILTIISFYSFYFLQKIEK